MNTVDMKEKKDPWKENLLGKAKYMQKGTMIK